MCKLDFADAKFSLYFLGYHPVDAIPEDPQDRVSGLRSRIIGIWIYNQKILPNPF